MNKVCVYAIAKNESKFVDRWFNSMRAADKIIVLDTGSEDDTVSKLRSYGVEVHETTYEHFRFDIARNDCLDLISDEYNIRVSIDLDEIFEQDNWVKIVKENWDENNPRIIYNYVWRHSSDGTPQLQYHINKIHGRDPYLRWIGAVHEHLGDIRTGDISIPKFVNLVDKLCVHHYPDRKKDRLFYKDLSIERLQENPDDFQSLLLYGNEERLKGDIHKAIAAYEKVLNECGDACDTITLAGTCYYLGGCYQKIGNGVKSLSYFSLGLGWNKRYRDNYYGLAVLYYANGLYDAVVGILEEGLKTSNRFYFWMEDNLVWTWPMYDLLGKAYAAKGDYKKAIGNALKALSFEPSNKELIKSFNKYKEKVQLAEEEVASV